MKKYTIKIDGMMCGMCESHINDALRKKFKNIKKVTSSHSKNLTTFLSEDDISADEIKKCIDDTGYTFVSLDSQEYHKKGFFF